MTFFLYYAVFLKVDFPKNAYSVAVFFSVMIRLKPFQWKIVITYLYSIRNTYVLELWVGLNSIPQELLTSCFHYFVYSKRKCDATFLSSLIIAKKTWNNRHRKCEKSLLKTIFFMVKIRFNCELFYSYSAMILIV